MKLPVLSASSTEEWLNCALRARLPEEKREPGEAAQVGTRFHKLVEGAVEAKQMPSLDPLDECFEKPLRATLEWLNEQLEPDDQVFTELAFELAPMGGYFEVPGQREPKWTDKLTCRVVKMAGHRQYPNIEGRIYGTADVVIVRKGKLIVYDWKTGKKSAAHEAQLATLGLMASLVYGITNVQVAAVYVNLKSGKVSCEAALLDDFDLHVHSAAIVRLSKELLRPELPDPNPGKYCFFCPALGCPEKLRTAR